MRVIFAMLTSTLMLAVVPAHAQDTGQAGTAPGSTGGDILVTARRRSESLRDVPGTVAAVTAEQLNARGPVTSTADLLNTIPGVRFNDVSSINLSEVSIRGSGTARATGADSGVGLFVNGAYVGSSTLGGRNFKTLDYFDLDRVESLQGPQGALYGRNSEFGVVNLVLAKPKFEDSGYARAIYTGGLDQGRLAAVINQKISDDVAVRIGGEGYTQGEGFYYDPNSNRHYDKTSGWTARGQIRLRSGGFDATLLADGQNLRLPTFVNSYVTLPGTVAALPKGFIQSRFTLPHSGRDEVRQKVQRTMLLAGYDFGWGRLDSTTMYYHWTSRQRYAAAVDLATEAALQANGQTGLYPFGQVGTDVRENSFYQDLHLSGKALDSRLSWTLGGEALIQHDNYRITSATTPCALTIGAGICTGTPAQPVCIRPLPTSTNCPAVFPLSFGTDSTTRQRVKSFAGYAGLQYTLGDVTLNGEGRYSHDDRRATQSTYALYTTNYTRVPTTFVFRANQPVWTFTASYKTPDPSHSLLYAKIGTGYRAGGVNNGSYNAAAPNPFQFTYDNERTISYEAGVKSSPLPNIFVKVAAYLSRTRDAITSINDGCTATNACRQGGQIFNLNGGTIHARGIEASLDGRFQLAGGRLSVGLNAANQHATFAYVPSGVSGLPVPDSNVAQIPRWTMSANLDYRHSITRTISGYINGTYSGQRGGFQDTTTLATPAIPLSDFDLFSLNAGLQVARVQLGVFVRNLTDQTIQLLKFQQGGFPLSVRYNQPRTIGGSISYTW